MKKGIVLILLLSCLSTTSCSCSCHRSAREQPIQIKSNKADKYLSFDELKTIATEPPTGENYKQTFVNIDADDRVEPLKCLGSTLYFAYINSNGPILRSVCNPSINITDIYRIDCKTDLLSYSYGCLYSEELPFFIYASKIGDNYMRIEYRDCYGNFLFEDESENIEITSLFSFCSRNRFYTYVEYSNGVKRYLRYKKKINPSSYENVYSVNVVDEEDFFHAYNNENFSYGELNYYCDSYGQPIGSVYSEGYDYVSLFDKNDSFIRKIDLKDYGVFSKTIYLEKKIYYFGESFDFSKADVTNRYYLEIDMLTGKTKFVDGFEYIIEEFNTYYDINNIFRYTYVRYYKVDSNGTKSKKEYCAILEDELTLDNQFVYDGFLGNVYRIDKDHLIASYEADNFIIDSDNNAIPLEGKLVFQNDNLYYIKERRGYYYLISYNDLKKISLKQIKITDYYQSHDGYDFISECRYANTRMFIRYDEDYNYYANDVQIDENYVYLAKEYGLILDPHNINTVFNASRDVAYLLPANGEIKEVYYYDAVGSIVYFEVEAYVQSNINRYCFAVLRF